MSAATPFPFEGEKPLFHLGDFPVRLITLLVAFHCVAMVSATLLIASGHGAWLDVFTYYSKEVAHGQIWRLLTYAFVSGPSIWFLLEMLMLYYFGREVENGLGWRRFGILYAGLILTGPLVMQGFAYGGTPQSLSGAQEVNFAVFAAFVAMHPGAQFFFGLAARWVFLGLLAISGLQLVADHQTARVVTLVASRGLAFMLMRRSGFEEPLLGWGFSWSLPQIFRPKTRLRVVQKGVHTASSSKTADSKPREFDPEEEMDRLLEKISREGIGSLTASERADLEQARKAILLRSGGA